MKCFTCNGSGIVTGIFPVWAEHVPEEDKRICVEISCFRCKKSGEVSDEAEQWVKDGKILGSQRRAKRVTLRKAAKLLNIDPILLSDNELGIVKPDMNLYNELKDNNE